MTGVGSGRTVTSRDGSPRCSRRSRTRGQRHAVTENVVAHDDQLRHLFRLHQNEPNRRPLSEIERDLACLLNHPDPPVGGLPLYHADWYRSYPVAREPGIVLFVVLETNAEVGVPLLDSLDGARQRSLGCWPLDPGNHGDSENGERVKRRSIAVACLLYVLSWTVICLGASLPPAAASGLIDRFQT